MQLLGLCLMECSRELRGIRSERVLADGEGDEGCDTAGDTLSHCR